MKDDILKLIGAIGLIILLLLFWPFIGFWICYFEGWLAKIMIGKYIVEWFALFNINLPIDKIPLFAGVLGWIAGFFKAINSTKKKD